MEESFKIVWSAPEYAHHQRSKDWYWALGTIVITACIASVIFANYFLAILIALGGGILFLFAIKEPEIVNFELDHDGLKVRGKYYPFRYIESFWIDPRSRDTLFIKSQRFYLPVMALPIPDENAEEIYSIFTSKEIPAEEMRKHASEHILDAFGL